MAAGESFQIVQTAANGQVLRGARSPRAPGPLAMTQHGKAGVTGFPVTPASVRVAGRAAQAGCGIGDPIRTWLPEGSRNPQSRTP